MLLSEAVLAVRNEGGFDSSSTASSDASLRGWVWQAVSAALTESKYRKQLREFGPTVANEAQYAIPDEVIEVTSLRVDGGRPYARAASLEDLWEVQAGNGYVRGALGVFIGTFEDDSDSVIELWPAPTEDGLPIEALCVLTLADVSSLNGADITLPLPADLTRPIAVNGAVAIGLRILEQRHSDAAEHEGKQDAAVKELKRRANTRVGRGPLQIPIRQP